MICNKCANEIPELNFSEEFLLEIRSLAAQNLKLFLVKQLMEQGVDHRHAKLITAHLNPKHGVCGGCDFERLEGECATCPECYSFNYNLKEPLFNETFCTHLEWSLDFDDLGMEEVKGFWCDGVSAFPFDPKSLSKAAIRKNREIVTEAYVGKGGQERYRMTIRFGPKALAHYERDLDLEECIPDCEYRDWIIIDPNEREIRIQLD